MYCFISKALDNSKRYIPEVRSKYFYPLYMYREAPDNEDDSGWRFFRGNETNEYVNDPHNIQIADLKDFLDELEDCFLGDLRSLRWLIADVPAGYQIDVRKEMFSGEVKFCNMIYMGQTFRTCSSIGLHIESPEQKSLPGAQPYGGWPDEWAVLFKNLSFEQRSGITKPDGSLIISKK